MMLGEAERAELDGLGEAERAGLREGESGTAGELWKQSASLVFSGKGEATWHYEFSFKFDTLDPTLLRPGWLDRKVEFGLPNLESRTQISQIHTLTMNCERDIRFELLASLCPNST
ncbi:hypothetical protein Droror1_Dr00020256, partial [Drosera rotundifolia]